MPKSLFNIISVLSVHGVKSTARLRLESVGILHLKMVKVKFKPFKCLVQWNIRWKQAVDIIDWDFIGAKIVPYVNRHLSVYESE